MVTVFDTLDKSVFDDLHGMLSKMTVKAANDRRGFPKKHRAMSFGMVKGRLTGKVNLSYNSKKYPKIYEEIMKIGKLICPFEFQAIHLNNNVVCPKHFDSNNKGDSVLISFGDYTGCNIVVDGIVYDAKYTPIMFNGAVMEHWNTDDLSGNKYSLVYYL